MREGVCSLLERGRRASRRALPWRVSVPSSPLGLTLPPGSPRAPSPGCPLPSPRLPAPPCVPPVSRRPLTPPRR